VTECRPLFLPTSMFQRYRCYRSHFQFIWCAALWDHGLQKSHFPSCPSYMVKTSFALRLGDTLSDHPTDILAFSVIVYLVVRSNVKKDPIPRLLKTIAQDATYYFLVIFTSHFVLVMFLAFAEVCILPSYSIFSLRLA